jgi:hypothetical protein
MLTGTNIVQNEKWDDPIPYDQIYFEYPSDALTKTYSKTKATKDGKGREDVTLGGVKWEGVQPVEDANIKAVNYQTPEKQQLVKSLFADALNKIQELFSEDVPELRLLQLASKGLNQQMQSDITATNKAVDKAKLRERMVRDYMAQKKVTRAIAEKRIDVFLSDEVGDEAA